MIYQQTLDCRNQLTEFRRKRIRCRDYTYGRQWNDLIEVDGRRITEYEYILREGNVPLKNNLIRRIVRNVLGVFRSRLPEIMKQYYGDELAQVAAANSLEEIYTRTMEEFLISGMAVTRKRLPGGYASTLPTTEMVSPDNFFFNTDSTDPRGWDLNMVGQLHLVDRHQWCTAFVKNADDLVKADQIFGDTNRTVKITEVWRKEVVPAWLVHDRKRAVVRKCRMPEDKSGVAGKTIPGTWHMEEVWRYYFLTEDGAELLSGDSPYPDGSHPYVFKAYPFLDGEIQSFVADMIDQQRYTNRLITLYDWVIRSSAKGVLLIPEGAVDPGNLRNVADQWGRFNGVIVYKSRPENPEPKQISGNMANLGISELLEIQLKMMEDVSGVNGILQGNTSGGNVSGALYDSQTANAMYSLSDLMETFTTFIADNARKDKAYFSS